MLGVIKSVGVVGPDLDCAIMMGAPSKGVGRFQLSLEGPHAVWFPTVARLPLGFPTMEIIDLARSRSVAPLMIDRTESEVHCTVYTYIVSYNAMCHFATWASWLRASCGGGRLSEC